MKNLFLGLSFLVLTVVSATAADGDLTLYKKSLRDCTQADQMNGNCTGEEDLYVACLTYENNTWDMKSCDLKGNALFKERYTGFTKRVFDKRREKLFPKQQHQICFNFLKDEYNLWELVKVGKPTVSCVSVTEDDPDADPEQNCDVDQNAQCDEPDIDEDTPCDPYDWSC